MHWSPPVRLFQTSTALESPRTSRHSVFASVELPSAISGWPSAVPVTSQSTVALAVLLEPSATEKRTSEWSPAILMPRSVFRPPSQATRMGLSTHGFHTRRG